MKTLKDIELSKKTKYILLSTSAEKGDCKEACECGFSGYLTKPIKRDELLNCMSMVLGLNDNEGKDKKIITKHTIKEENRILKPAIRMNLVRIAEQFSKLKDENEFKILDSFSSKDLKGISAVRNYIAHDYDSTDDNIIEDVIRHNLPELKKIIEELLKNS